MTNMPVNNVKRISISSKRQITIPQAFFSALGFENEAECIFKDNQLIIRPISSDSSDEFSEQILTELVKEGYSGESLLLEFKNRKSKTKLAIKEMLKEADNVAAGKSKYMSIDDIFKDK